MQKIEAQTTRRATSRARAWPPLEATEDRASALLAKLYDADFLRTCQFLERVRGLRILCAMLIAIRRSKRRRMTNEHAHAVSHMRIAQLARERVSSWRHRRRRSWQAWSRAGDTFGAIRRRRGAVQLVRRDVRVGGLARLQGRADPGLGRAAHRSRQGRVVEDLLRRAGGHCVEPQPGDHGIGDASARPAGGGQPGLR